MQIVQINTNDINGGAAKAAYRIHRGLINNGYQSEMIVQNQQSDDYTVIRAGKSKTEKLMNKITSLVDHSMKKIHPSHLSLPWSVNFFDNNQALDLIRSRNYDIVHLHWINDAFLSIRSISKINRPVVWTLHDTWAFTGGCHYFGECFQYINKCKECSQLNSKNTYDLSSFLFIQKKKAYSKSNITIVTPSKWLAECAKQSFLLQDKRIEVIPNGIDLDIYKSIPQKVARDILNINNEDLVIMFGAMSSISDPRKGYIYLKKALQELKYELKDEALNKRIRVVIFGANQKIEDENLGYPISYTGYVSDDVTLNVLYNCADVFVAPSKEDNLPNTIVEALACGTPCVAFHIGGMPDMIEHKRNGYLAKPFESGDLARGIAYVLKSRIEQGDLSYNARKKAIDFFDINLTIKNYVALYKDIL